MRRTYKTVQREIWIADNGREFDNEADCLRYEAEMDKIKDVLESMEVAKDVIPHGFSTYDDIHYTWYKVATPEEVEVINKEINVDWCSLNNIKSFPEYVCIETDYDDERYAETTLTKLMEEYAQFLEIFGVKITYKMEA